MLLVVAIGSPSARPAVAEGTGVDGGALVLDVVRVEDHAPVRGATATLSGTSRGGRAVSLVVATDAEGRAAFDDVPEGFGYRLTIAAPGIPARELAGLRVRRALQTRLQPVFMGPRVALEGRFVDDAGAPVPGAVVLALDGFTLGDDGPKVFDAAEAAEVLGLPDPTPLAIAVTDLEGRYRMDGLPTGPILLHATAEGRRETRARVFLGTDGPDGGPPTRVLRAGSEVRGIVVDGDGRVIAGAQVVVVSARGDSDERREVVTDAAGRFRTIVADAGPFVVSAGRPNGRLRTWGRFDDPPAEVRISLSTSTRLAITFLDQGEGRPLPGTSVEVQIRGSMSPLDQDHWTTTVSGAADGAGRVSLAVPEGFVSSWVVTSPGHVGAAVDNVWWIPSGDMDVVQAVFERHLEAGKPVDLTLRLRGDGGSSGAAIEGRVVDPAGRPVADALVVGAAIGAISPRPARSDADGRFRLEGAAEELFVRARGFVQRAEARAIARNEEGAPRPSPMLRLDRPASVRGRIVDPEGCGVAGATVSILPWRSNDRSITTESRGVVEALRHPWGTTSADGTYVLRDLVPLVSVPLDERGAERRGAAPGSGPATIVVRARGFCDAVSVPFTYLPGVATDAPTVRLSRGARWRGRVVDPTGHVVPGAAFQVDAVGNDTSNVTFPGAGSWRAAGDGSFVIGALPKGTVKIAAWAKGFAAGQRSMHVTGEGELPSLDVVLREAKTIVGRVVDPAGSPIELVKVFVSWLDRIPEHPASGAQISDAEWDERYVSPVATTSDATGRFALTGCPAGRLKLQFERPGWRTPNSTRSRGVREVATDGLPVVLVLEREPPPEPVKR